jgi:hypothetical protein
LPDLRHALQLLEGVAPVARVFLLLGRQEKLARRSKVVSGLGVSRRDK